jgi:hypothetical protein
MARRDDREYRAIFEGGATQPAPGPPTRQPRWGGLGMHRRPNAAGLLPRAVNPRLLLAGTDAFDDVAVGWVRETGDWP